MLLLGAQYLVCVLLRLLNPILESLPKYVVTMALLSSQPNDLLESRRAHCHASCLSGYSVERRSLFDCCRVLIFVCTSVVTC